MSKLSNTLTMLNLLSTGKKYTVNELAEILEVTPRMVRSYKEDLDKCGIYVDTIMGPYGGYVLNNTVKQPIRKFKNSDYEFLINLEVSESDKEKLKLIADKVRGTYLGSSTEKTTILGETKDTYNMLMRAIKEQRKVLINYYSYTKGDNERIIHPLDMFYLPSGWGVAAYCEMRKDLRHFELRRINSIKLLDEFYN
jgi:predicted DNA-binding transcriptional regulator YafY